MQSDRFRHGAGQGQGGLAVALHLIGKDAAQQFPAEGQAKVIAEHAKGRDRRFQGALAPMPGVGRRWAFVFIVGFLPIRGRQLGGVGDGAVRELLAMVLPAIQQQGLPTRRGVAAVAGQGGWGIHQAREGDPVEAKHP